MCLTVRIDDEWIETVGQMHQAIGCDPIWMGGYPDGVSARDDVCLCGIDMVACAALIGRVVDWNDSGDTVFTRPAAKGGQ